MLLKLVDDRFHIVLTEDDVATLVADICLLMDLTQAKHHEAGYCVFTWEMVTQINRMWFTKYGCSIGDAIEEYMGLEAEED